MLKRVHNARRLASFCIELPKIFFAFGRSRRTYFLTLIFVIIGTILEHTSYNCKGLNNDLSYEENFQVRAHVVVQIPSLIARGAQP